MQIISFVLLIILFISLFSTAITAQDGLKIANDITQLNPISVAEIIHPISTEEIIKAVKTHNSISIGGGLYSMGGQTATEKALQIDMRNFNRILNFSEANKEITVETGINWRKIQ